jgi:hypothetical protein
MSRNLFGIVTFQFGNDARWRTLLSDIAAELGLDIGLDYDLAAVAQYHLNMATVKRSKLTKRSQKRLQIS